MTIPACHHPVDPNEFVGVVLAGAWSHCQCCARAIPTVHGLTPWICHGCGGTSQADYEAALAATIRGPRPWRRSTDPVPLHTRLTEFHAARCTTPGCTRPGAHGRGRHAAATPTLRTVYAAGLIRPPDPDRVTRVHPDATGYVRSFTADTPAAIVTTTRRGPTVSGEALWALRLTDHHTLIGPPPTAPRTP